MKTVYVNQQCAKRYPSILIVEDNALDAQLTIWALAEAGFGGEPIVVKDGSEALTLFKGEGCYKGQAVPDLVILDLNLKLVDGPEVLQFIRDTPELHDIKVAILSSAPEYIMRTKAAKADWYFSKSSSLDVYSSLGKRILESYHSQA